MSSNLYEGKLKLNELRDISRKLKFQNVRDKSGLNLRQELQHLAKTFLAGQVHFDSYFFLCVKRNYFWPLSYSY